MDGIFDFKFMNYVSWCSGIGGFEKGIEQAYERLCVKKQGFRKGTGTQRNGNSKCADIGSDGFARCLGIAENNAHEQIGQSIHSGFECRASVGCESQLPTCVGYAEIDRFAKAIYAYHYPDHKNYGDATTIVCDELPDFDLFCAGFPCQSFSIAGKRRGFDDTRGTIFFEIARVLSHKRPAHFLLENVRGLVSHDGGKTLHRILEVLSGLGYFVEMFVLNSKDFGVPQNRERVFFVGHLGDRCSREILSFGNGYEEIIQAEYERNLSGTISTKNQSGQCNFDGSTTLIFGKDGQRKNKSVTSALTGGGHSGGNHSDMDLISKTVRSGGQKSPFRSKQNWDTYEIENRIRRLTPIECARLQGFPDDWAKYGLFENEVKEISDSQQYKCYGNAVTTNVIEAIITRMIEKGCLEI